MKILSDYELSKIKAGEALTITTIMAVLATAIVAVIVYRLFMSSEGSTTLPGGWKFTWE